MPNKENNNIIWKYVYINNIITNYKVSNTGSIFNIKTSNYLMGSHDSRGYVVVSIYSKEKLYSKKIHRLVAEAFIPNPENKPQVNHIDGDKKNNHVSNLEWVTCVENIHHAINTGLRDLKGINSSSNVYSEKQVHDVCKLLEKNKTPKEISELLNVPRNLINRIKYLGKWKHISSKYKIVFGPSFKKKLIKAKCSTTIENEPEIEEELIYLWERE